MGRREFIPGLGSGVAWPVTMPQSILLRADEVIQ
jgi:hypothetical protein